MSVSPAILWAPPTDYDHSHLIRACRDDMDYWQCRHVCYDFKLHRAKRHFDACAMELNLSLGGKGAAIATKASQIRFWLESVGKAEHTLQRLLQMTPSEHWAAWREGIRQDWRNHLDAPGFQQMWRISGDVLRLLENDIGKGAPA